MELKELKKKSQSDLHKLLNESRDRLRDLRFKDANKQLKDVRQIRKVRQTIARAMMLLNLKKTAKSEPSDPAAGQKAEEPQKKG